MLFYSGVTQFTTNARSNTSKTTKMDQMVRHLRCLDLYQFNTDLLWIFSARRLSSKDLCDRYYRYYRRIVSRWMMIDNEFMNVRFLDFMDFIGYYAGTFGRSFK